MISGHGTIETAVQAIRNGAYDFIEKPFKEERLLMMVARALESAKLARENNELRAKMTDGVAPELVGKSAVMQVSVNQLIKRHQRQAGCLLMGQVAVKGGALCIHNKSDRRDERFVVANCARLASNGWMPNYLVRKASQSHRRVVGLF